VGAVAIDAGKGGSPVVVESLLNVEGAFVSGKFTGVQTSGHGCLPVAGDVLRGQERAEKDERSDEDP
jgi:hypothetical protein